jgi:hypothetical protein
LNCQRFQIHYKKNFKNFPTKSTLIQAKKQLEICAKIKPMMLTALGIIVVLIGIVFIICLSSEIKVNWSKSLSRFSYVLALY